MAFEERVQILSTAEQDEFYGPPIFTISDQRFFFALNDKERSVANSLRHRAQRCMFVVLLGYFKAKPVVLSLSFGQVKHDLKYVYQTVLPGPGFRPFNLSQKESDRIYQRIFQLCGYQRWNANAPIWPFSMSARHGVGLRRFCLTARCRKRLPQRFPRRANKGGSSTSNGN